MPKNKKIHLRSIKKQDLVDIGVGNNRKARPGIAPNRNFISPSKKNVNARAHHQPAWLRDQHSKRKKVFWYLYRTIGAILLFFLVGFFSLNVRNIFLKNSFDPQNNFVFCIMGNKRILVLIYRPTSNLINILDIAGNTYLPLAKGFGEYQAGSIWQLGQLEKFGGGELLRLTTQFFLDTPVQGWAKVDKLGIEDQEIADTGKKISKPSLILLLAGLAFNGDKNISSIDLARLIKAVILLPSNKINYYWLDQTRAGEEVKLPDGETAYRIQEDFLKSLIKDIVKDSHVLEESIVLAVINTTDHAGLASRVAGLIDGIGGDVVLYIDRKQPFVQGFYCWDENICSSYTARLLAKSLNLDIKKQLIDESGAEAVIILGEDFWEHFYQK